MTNLRDMFRPSTEKIPPDLRHALTLLELTTLTELEEHFLATTAFLIPWSIFRDACLLVNNPRAGGASDVTRLDILWFYTQFDEGLQRHDPRAERPGATFEINKITWGATEHETHLHAWLLQTFCVGKTNSPFAFRYFELRNVCAAWDQVFVPIVNAVRASYSAKGRRYYGRLALFIEERCPSRLAFPEGNVSMPSGVMNSPTPFRMVSRPTHLRGASQNLLTRKNYEEAEKELRDVYPQYGGLVERPRFKQKMDEWLEVQRMRAAHRKTIAKPEVVQYVAKCQPQVLQQIERKSSRSPIKSPSLEKRSHSPLKRYSDTIRRSLSMNVGNSRFGKSEPHSPLSPTRPKTPEMPKVPMIPYGMYSYVPKIPKEQPKSPLHGVTREIYIPDPLPDEERQQPQKTDVKHTELPDDDSWPLPASNLSRPELPKQRLSEQSVYTTVRKSNPFREATARSSAAEGEHEDHIWSPMGAPSAIPPPLKKAPDAYDEPMPQSLLRARKPHSDTRHPSYEGTGYQEEISLTKLHSRKVSKVSEVANGGVEPPKPRSRLPAPIKLPPPYVSQLRIASNDTYRNNTAPPHPDGPSPSEATKNMARPWFEQPSTRPSHTASAVAPPIPAKSIERWGSNRGQQSEQLPRQRPFESQAEQTSHEMLRIVSKENIRAALGSLTPESSIEDLRAMNEKKVPRRIASPPRLEAYNTHMFPRKN